MYHELRLNLGKSIKVIIFESKLSLSKSLIHTVQAAVRQGMSLVRTKNNCRYSQQITAQINKVANTVHSFLQGFKKFVVGGKS